MQDELVGHDAPHFGRCQEHVFGPFFGEELFYRILPAQIQFLMSSGDDIRITLPLQFAKDGRAYHAPVPGHVYF